MTRRYGGGGGGGGEGRLGGGSLQWVLALVLVLVGGASRRHRRRARQARQAALRRLGRAEAKGGPAEAKARAAGRRGSCWPGGWRGRCPTYIGQRLVLLLELRVGLEQRLLHLVQVSLQLLHPLLKVVNLLLGLARRGRRGGAGRTHRGDNNKSVNKRCRGGRRRRRGRRRTYILQSLFLLVKLSVSGGQLLLSLVELVLDLLHLLLSGANLLLGLGRKLGRE